MLMTMFLEVTMLNNTVEVLKFDVWWGLRTSGTVRRAEKWALLYCSVLERLLNSEHWQGSIEQVGGVGPVSALHLRLPNHTEAALRHSSQYSPFFNPGCRLLPFVHVLLAFLCEGRPNLLCFCHLKYNPKGLWKWNIYQPSWFYRKGF